MSSMKNHKHSGRKAPARYESLQAVLDKFLVTEDDKKSVVDGEDTAAGDAVSDDNDEVEEIDALSTRVAPCLEISSDDDTTNKMPSCTVTIKALDSLLDSMLETPPPTAATSTSPATGE